ncbi:ATPase family protein 2 homolog [Galendromus occidentalis]|uniref:ATPase family protein 2 homolog n=1 Tax=Galendromus occidentalis TaxID=34638 RepID=A0AAJ6QS06_9ACAR|nr:ATPase family protein 2 homolog [Galendromus occidentalis]
MSYDDIGGLRLQKQTLQGLTRIPEEKVRKLLYLGKFPPRRLLLVGPPGTGKSLLVRAAAADLSLEIVEVTTENAVKVLGGDAHETSRLAKKASTSLVLVDNLDAFSSRKDKESQGRLVAFLKRLPEQTLVIATTNKPSNVDEILQALFDREIEITIPSSDERLEILKLSLRDMPHDVTDLELTEVTLSLHGYTGANIETLVREALATSMRDPGEICIRAGHLKQAVKVVRPLEMRDVVLEIPKVNWKDIGGMEDVKKRFRQCVEWPILHKEAFQRFKIKPPSGLLMYGPPGCSKTMIARALATESSLNFLAVNGSELFSKWVGDSEKAVRDLFRRARNVAPAVVFFDEIDAIATKRNTSSGGSGVGDRVLAQLLTEIDGIEGLENVILIAATNRPDMIDEALLRPGRLDCVVYVPLPDTDTRREILRIELSERQAAEDVLIDDLVVKTEGYSGAEIVAVVQEAVMKALEESFEISAIGKRHFLQALDAVRPRISAESIAFYEQFHKAFNKR